MLVFRPLTLEDQPIVERYLQSMHVKSCDSCFANLFAWREVYNYHIYNCEHFVFVRGGREGGYTFLMPVGEGDMTSCFDRLTAYCASLDQPLILDLVEEPFDAHIPAAYQSRIHATPQRDAFDYCYLREHLAFLRGNTFGRKRNHFNKFRAEYEYTFAPLTAADLPEALAFAYEWAQDIGLDLDAYEASEGRALKEFFTHYDTLHARGAVLRIADRIVAFTAGSPHHPGSDCFVTHFEKAHRDFDGAYAAINKLFAEHILSDFVWVNREDDMGLPSLRKAKESYSPDLLLPKYRLEVL